MNYCIHDKYHTYIRYTENIYNYIIYMYNFIRSKNKRIETTNHFTDNLEKLVHITRKKKRKKQLQSYHRLLYTEYN